MWLKSANQLGKKIAIAHYIRGLNVVGNSSILSVTLTQTIRRAILKNSTLRY